MFVSLSGRALVFALGLIIGFGSTLSASAKESKSPPAQPAVVDLFAGIDDGTVEVIVIPRDSKKVTLQLKNMSDKPLRIRLPEAFAAVPVQAQFLGAGDPPVVRCGVGERLPVRAQFAGGGGRNGGIGFGQGFGGIGAGDNQAGGQGGGAQGLGVAGRGQNGGGGRNGGGFPGGGAGIFNVPAGKVIKVKLTSVCLEYGKPEPHARHEYVIQPIETICDKAEVVSILRSLGDGQVSQEVAQLAAWNVANGTSFEMLASLKSKLGLQTPVYNQNVLSAAAELVKVVSAQATADASRTSATASTSAGR